MIEELDEAVAGTEPGDLVLDDLDFKDRAKCAEDFLQHRLVDVGVQVSDIQRLAARRVGPTIANKVHGETRRGLLWPPRPTPTLTAK